MFVVLFLLSWAGNGGAFPDLRQVSGLDPGDQLSALAESLGAEPLVEMASDALQALALEHSGSERSKRSMDLMSLMVEASEAASSGAAMLDGDTLSPGKVIVSYAMKATPAVLKVLSNNRTGDEDPVILLAELAVIGLQASPLVIQVAADMYNNTSPDPEQVSQLVDLAAEATPILVQLAIQESPDSVTNALSKLGPFTGAFLKMENSGQN